MGKRENVLKNLKKNLSWSKSSDFIKDEKINNDTVLKISCYENAIIIDCYVFITWFAKTFHCVTGGVTTCPSNFECCRGRCPPGNEQEEFCCAQFADSVCW